MIRTTFLKIKKVCAISGVPRLLLGRNDLILLSNSAAVGKFEKLTYGYQCIARKSTKAGGGTTELPPDTKSEDAPKNEKGEEIDGEDVINKEDVTLVAAQDAPPQETVYKGTEWCADDCNRILAEIFGEEPDNILTDDIVLKTESSHDALAPTLESAPLDVNFIHSEIFDVGDSRINMFPDYLSEFDHCLPKDSFRSILYHEAVIINDDNKSNSTGHNKANAAENLYDLDPQDNTPSWQLDSREDLSARMNVEHLVDSYWTGAHETLQAISKEATKFKTSQAIDENTLKVYKAIKNERPINDDTIKMSKRMKHTREELDRILFGNPYEHDFVRATTVKEESEKLIQKIEQIRETPLVDSEKSKVEGFNVSPKSLEKTQRVVNVVKDDNLDEIAGRCINSPSNKIDEILVKEIKKANQPLGVKKTSGNESKLGGVSIRNEEIDADNLTLQAKKTASVKSSKTNIGKDASKPVVEKAWTKDQIDPRHVLACNESCPIAPNPLYASTPVKSENKTSMINQQPDKPEKNEKKKLETSTKSKVSIDVHKIEEKLRRTDPALTSSDKENTDKGKDIFPDWISLKYPPISYEQSLGNTNRQAAERAQGTAQQTGVRAQITNSLSKDSTAQVLHACLVSKQPSNDRIGKDDTFTKGETSSNVGMLDNADSISKQDTASEKQTSPKQDELASADTLSSRTPAGVTVHIQDDDRYQTVNPPASGSPDNYNYSQGEQPANTPATVQWSSSASSSNPYPLYFPQDNQNMPPASTNNTPQVSFTDTGSTPSFYNNSFYTQAQLNFYKTIMESNGRLQTTTEEISMTTERLRDQTEKLKSATKDLIATSEIILTASEKFLNKGQNSKANTFQVLEIEDMNFNIPRARRAGMTYKIPKFDENIKGSKSFNNIHEHMFQANILPKTDAVFDTTPPQNEELNKIVDKVYQLYTRKDYKAQDKKDSIKKPARSEPSHSKRQNDAELSVPQQTASLATPITVTDDIPILKPLPKLNSDVKLSELLQLVRERNRLLTSPRVYVAVEPKEETEAKKNIPPLSQPRHVTKVYMPPSYPEYKPIPKMCPPPRKKTEPKKDKCVQCDLQTLGLESDANKPDFSGYGGTVDPATQSVTIANEVPNSADLTEEIILQLQMTGDVLRAAFQYGKMEVLEAAALSKSRSRRMNRSKDYDPWNAIPSWPYVKKHERPKVQCPKDGCKVPPPQTPDCLPGGIRPCKTFPTYPKRVFSMHDFLTVTFDDHEVIDLKEV